MWSRKSDAEIRRGARRDAEEELLLLLCVPPRFSASLRVPLIFLYNNDLISATIASLSGKRAARKSSMAAADCGVRS